MTRWLIVAGLIVLNGILGAAVYMHLGGERTAQAQMGGSGPRVDVQAVAGMSSGQPIIYMLDANSGMLVAQRVDAANGKMVIVNKRNIAADLR